MSLLLIGLDIVIQALVLFVGITHKQLSSILIGSFGLLIAFFLLGLHT